MDPITQQQALAAAGAGGDPVYVDDVFSTYLWEGTGSTQTITNGIDLAGEGGMIWTKGREVVENHMVHDSERGKTGSYYDALQTNVSNADYTDAPYGPTSFNSDGFTLGGNNAQFNGSTDGGYCSWTFRKCPGFFDVVTYTGNGSAGHTVAHNLGSVPGCIIIKRLDVGTDWLVYHRGLDSSAPEDYRIVLNSDAARESDEFNIAWNSTAPTATQFTLGTYSRVNANGGTYVAYIFAHNDQSFGTDGDEAIIECGNYTGNGTSGHEINVGFEPQWLMIKRSSGSQDWMMFDNMRGLPVGHNDTYLEANNSIDEQTSDPFLDLTATGFKITNTNTVLNGSGSTYIYVAIRRPHKPPEAGTDVFAIDTRTGSNPSFVSNFPVDMGWKRTIDTSFSMNLATRLTGTNYLLTNSSAGQTSDPGFVWDYMDGWAEDGGANSSVYSWMFKRAPGFFDVVNYVATGGNTTNNVPHNLGVPPEMIIAKKRGAISGWPVYHTATGLSTSTKLHVDTIDQYASNYWSSAPSATHFYPYGSDTNANNGEEWIALLFATLPGISKVGSYTGTAADGLQVDCGFTAGARFVMIKRADGTGPWYVFDSTRGIVSGNDPYIQLNSNAAQLSNNDIVDPYNPGFIVNNVGTGVNASGGTYLFLAIA